MLLEELENPQPATIDPPSVLNDLPNLGLRLYPDGILNRKCSPVTKFGEDLKKTAASMVRLMDALEGAGLAASQAGLEQSILVYKVLDQMGTLVNPEITWKSEETQTLSEGCLSFPGVFITVKRAKDIHVNYQDCDGQHQQLVATGMLAQVIQHEVDHLNGRTFTWYLSNIKRDIVDRKMRKFKKETLRRREQYEQLAREFKQQQPQSESKPVESGVGSGRDTGAYDFSVQTEPT